MIDKDGLITRSFEFDIQTREDGDKGILEGRAIVYNKKYKNMWFEETIAEGALENTNMKDVRFLVNHNIDMVPLARSRRNNENSTMQLIKDDKGLKVKIKLDIKNNSDALNLYSAVKRGDISGMSFMFSVKDDGEKWNSGNDEEPTKRIITDIEQIYEVSAVTFPAYEETEINARCRTELDNFRSKKLDNFDNVLDRTDNSVDNIDLLKLKQKIKLNL